MISIADITEDITTTLKSVSEVGNRVFPIVATEGTAYPFIVYERTGTSVRGTKDGYADLAVTFNVRIVSATYFEGLQILDKVVAKLERPESLHGIGYNIRLDGSNEEYTDNCFVQTLTFTI